MKSTFFVPGWTAERWPDVVAEIHRRGHEMGHHGYLHEALEGKSREEEEAILTGSSKILADITGRRRSATARRSTRSPTRRRASSPSTASSTRATCRTRCGRTATQIYRPSSSCPRRGFSTTAPSSRFGLRPNLYRQIFPPSAVRSVWGDEFRGIHALGGLTMLILHPQYTRPSLATQHAAAARRRDADTGDVWFVNGIELARYALTDAANISSDGRPRA